MIREFAWRREKLQLWLRVLPKPNGLQLSVLYENNPSNKNAYAWALYLHSLCFLFYFYNKPKHFSVVYMDDFWLCETNHFYQQKCLHLATTTN